MRHWRRPARTPKGLDLSAMPQPADMAPAAVHLAGEASGWCTGRVLFSAGPEISLIAPPRLLEAVGTGGPAGLAVALATVSPVVLGPAEAGQRSTGGSNPRFGPLTDAAPTDPGPLSRSCLVAGDRPGGALVDALARWGYRVVATEAAKGFADAEDTLRRAAAETTLDAVVVVDRDESTAGTDWRAVLGSHAGTTERVLAHAAWSRAVARHAVASGTPFRVVHLAEALSAGGRSAAQAVAQLARSANDTPSDVEVLEFAIGAEGGDPAALVARLVAADDTRALAGAELVVRPGWAGLRSHPAPTATVSLAGAALGDWTDDALRDALH